MTPNEKLDVARILEGYDSWRRQQVLQMTQTDNMLSVSHYLDAIAKDRAVAAVQELSELLNNFDMPLESMFIEARAILGVGQVEQ